jgi:hypothetical protein
MSARPKIKAPPGGSNTWGSITRRVTLMPVQYITRSKTRSASHVTKIWKRITPEPEVETPYVPDWQVQLEEVEAEIEAASNTGLIRPPWGPGLTNQEIMAVAKHEGLNCYRPDWFDSLDSELIREAKRGSFRRGVTHTLTELKAERTRLRRELAWSR